MHILSAILLGISTNLDNLLIGFSMGLQGRRIGRGENALIAAISVLAAGVCCCFSALFVRFGRLPNLAGGALMLLLGVRGLLPERGEGAQRCCDCASPMRETLLLGLCLALNCIPVSFAAGLTGIPPWAAAVSVGAMSMLLVGEGNRMGLRAHAPRLKPRALNRIGALMLVALGAMEMLL